MDDGACSDADEGDLCACQARGKAPAEDHERPAERPCLKIVEKAGSRYNEQIDAACAADRVQEAEDTAQNVAGEAVERFENAGRSAGRAGFDGGSAESGPDGLA